MCGDKNRRGLSKVVDEKRLSLFPLRIFLRSAPSVGCSSTLKTFRKLTRKISDERLYLTVFCSFDDLKRTLCQ